jgi:hypothetical protein
LVSLFAACEDLFKAQDGKMLGGVGLFDSQPFDDDSRRELSVPKNLDNRDPSRVPKCLKNAGLKFPKGVWHRYNSESVSDELLNL